MGPCSEKAVFLPMRVIQIIIIYSPKDSWDWDFNKVMQFTNVKKENINSSKPALKIITLSGTESVTKNMTLYECGEDIIAVDCGVGFPDSEMLGVDVVIPDMTYLYENAHRVRGLFITHGHEDHIGSIPYLLRELNIPIYANKLVQGFIKEKLSDKFFKDIFEKTKFVLISPE